MDMSKKRSLTTPFPFPTPLNYPPFPATLRYFTLPRDTPLVLP